MSMIDEFEKIADELSTELGTERSQMFGKPCIKINGKAFACFFNNEMVFKLGKADADKIFAKYKGAINFDPSGKKRPMKDWFQIPAEYKKEWKKLAKQALAFVEGS